MRMFLPLNGLHWYLRLPSKGLMLLLTVFLVLFPYPGQFVTHVQRWQNPEMLINPDAPVLQSHVEHLQTKISESTDGPKALRIVEQYVYEILPYAWDWDNWGAADYIPTVEEAFEKGKEDCDGRAVVAASLLRRLGFQADIVTDFTHVWVKTDAGETMSPGKTTAIVATDKGLNIQPNAAWHAIRSVSYGISVFPLSRQFIIIFAVWYLMLSDRGRWRGNVVAAILILSGFFILRLAGTNHRNPNEAMQLVGIVEIAAGLLLLLSQPFCKAPSGATETRAVTDQPIEAS